MVSASVKIEQLTTRIAGMDRPTITRELRAFDGGFKIDFTDDYLRSAPLDRLRHILLAAKLRERGRN